MSKIATALQREIESALQRKVIAFSTLAEAARNEEASATYEDLIRKGCDPVHAVYATTINLVSLFMDAAAGLEPLRRALKSIAKAHDLYVPGYPPMSPITDSLFTTWSQFDLPFGPDRETIGDCFEALSGVLRIGEIRKQAIEQLRRSRLGIHRVTGRVGTCFRLRELVTNAEIEALVPSGFSGETGEILLVRLLPPLRGETSYHVAVTTPYLLVGFREKEWLEYFARHQIVPGTIGMAERLQQHLKFGPKPDYWLEFIFWGYMNYRSDAILLTGLPDLPATQPQHESFDPRSAKTRFAV